MTDKLKRDIVEKTNRKKNRARYVWMFTVGFRTGDSILFAPPCLKVANRKGGDFTLVYAAHRSRSPRIRFMSRNTRVTTQSDEIRNDFLRNFAHVFGVCSVGHTSRAFSATRCLVRVYKYYSIN